VSFITLSSFLGIDLDLCDIEVILAFGLSYCLDRCYDPASRLLIGILNLIILMLGLVLGNLPLGSNGFTSFLKR
jgi:hypothetical protein